jgi:hypothetical protein
MAQRSHFKLHYHLAQLLDRPGPAHIAVPDEGHGLTIKLGEQIVHGVLERGRIAVVVLSGDNDEAVGSVDGLAEPSYGVIGVVTWRAGRRDGALVHG